MVYCTLGGDEFDDLLRGVGHGVAGDELEAGGGKATLAFAAKGDALTTATPFAEGNAYPVALTYKADANAKPVNFRLKLDLGQCGECKLKEYACICDH